MQPRTLVHALWELSLTLAVCGVDALCPDHDIDKCCSNRSSRGDFVKKKTSVVCSESWIKFNIDQLQRKWFPQTSRCHKEVTCPARPSFWTHSCSCCVASFETNRHHVQQFKIHCIQQLPCARRAHVAARNPFCTMTAVAKISKQHSLPSTALELL